MHLNTKSQKWLKCIPLSLLLILGLTSAAQSPFVLRGEIAAPTIIASFSALGGAFELSRLHPMPSEERILALDRMQINSFDRSATHHHSHLAAGISDATLMLSPAVQLILLGSPQSRRDFGKIVVMDAEVFLLTTGITSLFKDGFHRPRPLVYNPDIPMSQRRKPDNFKSFFSGHTSTVASQTFFFAYVYTTYHPDSKWLPLVWSLSAAFPILTGTMRYKAGKHFWTDIIAGYVAGALVGVAVPALHRATLWHDTSR